VLLVLLIGFGAANIFFWNRSLLLSFNLPEYVLKVAFGGMLLKIGLAFLIVPRLGYMAEAVLLSAYFVGTVGIIVGRGLREMRRQKQAISETG